jgi:hypothetical protein
MQHDVKYTVNEKYFSPHVVDCSCQGHGEFNTKEGAQKFIEYHLRVRGNRENRFGFSITGLEVPELADLKKAATV